MGRVSQTIVEIKLELNSIHSEQACLDKCIADLNRKHTALQQEVADLEISLQFSSEQHHDLISRVDNICKQNKNVESQEGVIYNLEIKFNTFEQQSRQCNIDLRNVLIQRSENVINLIKTISSKHKCSLTHKDIIVINRVPHAHTQSKQPENIIVKLNSRILRDNLRLTRLKPRPTRYIRSTTTAVYERASEPKSKQLFREYRNALKNNFSYNFKVLRLISCILSFLSITFKLIYSVTISYVDYRYNKCNLTCSSVLSILLKHCVLPLLIDTGYFLSLGICIHPTFYLDYCKYRPYNMLR